jgi:hypothetical protein
LHLLLVGRRSRLTVSERFAFFFFALKALKLKAKHSRLIGHYRINDVEVPDHEISVFPNDRNRPSGDLRLKV